MIFTITMSTFFECTFSFLMQVHVVCMLSICTTLLLPVLILQYKKYVFKNNIHCVIQTLFFKRDL